MNRFWQHLERQRPLACCWQRGNLKRSGYRTRDTRSLLSSSEDATVAVSAMNDRYLFWIDAVGGFLVVRGDRIELGQPVGESTGGVGIRADLSRRHAVIHRDGGKYVLEPIHATSLDGRELTGPTLIQNGQLIGLGDSVRLRFTQPHVLSASAILKIESHHKSEPATDGIVLMADSCVIGPRGHSHIVAPGWLDDLVVFKHRDGLRVRSKETLEINGVKVSGSAKVDDGSRIVGEQFSFSIERLPGTLE